MIKVQRIKRVLVFFSSQFSNKRRILLIGCGVNSRAAIIGIFPSIRGVSSRAAFNRVNTVRPPNIALAKLKKKPFHLTSTVGFQAFNISFNYLVPLYGQFYALTCPFMESSKDQAKYDFSAFENCT